MRTDWLAAMGCVAVVALVGACGGNGGSGEDVRVDARIEISFTPDVRLPDIPVRPDLAPADVPPDIPIARCASDAECAGLVEGEGPCAPARCDMEAGRCALAPLDDGTSCDDGDACTPTTACAAARCVPTDETRLACDDGNPCTDDRCDPASGCVAAPNEVLCDDGRVCTVDDRCREGTCTGAPRSCDDADPCTDEVCREPDGCVRSFNTAPCDDRDACTSGDRCDDGECVAGRPTSCDDGNACTSDSCHSIDGCRHAPNQLPCEDSNACTVGDRCGEGTCHAGTYSPECPTCVADYECRPFDDGNRCNGVVVCAAGECQILAVTVVTCPDASGPCARAVCDPATGDCREEPLPDALPCDDGDVCTSGDACVGGQCVGQGPDCDDGNPCTSDTCDPAGGCRYAHADGLACDDGDPCTAGDSCGGGLCAPGPDFVCITCQSDGDCTSFDDGDLCNGVLACTGGTCQLDTASVVICDTTGDTTCRQTVCAPLTGTCDARDAATGTACDDGQRCTVGDGCAAGACAATPVTCDDGDPCTVDVCDEATGACVHTSTDGPCEDGNPCTEGDFCTGGACVSGSVRDCDDDNPCTVDYCELPDGCHHDPLDIACDDGDACTRDDRCSAGECVGSEVDCGDDNPCTQDSCDAAGACRNTPVAGGCDDGDACTSGDTCVDGRCTPGGPADCDDRNPCTGDECDPVLGCVHDEPVPGPCDDGDRCTTGDRCEAGACLSGEAVDCDDANLCTDDTCGPLVGCVHTDNTVACDDADPCTAADRCRDGDCRAGAPISCDDEDVCTDDSCVPGEGCAHAFNTAACDDGNPCTAPDGCNAGACVAGPIVCTESVCGDAVDDDTDGLTDCADADCEDVPPCLPCVPAEEIACGGQAFGTVISPSATDNVDSYSCREGAFTGREYTYRFRPGCLAQVRVWLDTSSPSPSGGYARLHALVVQEENERCDGRHCVAAAVPVQQATKAHAEVTFPAMWDATYDIVVDGLDGDEGPYSLYVTCTPVSALENCTDRIDNDCDGDVDCDDQGCVAHPSCR